MVGGVCGRGHVWHSYWNAFLFDLKYTQHTASFLDTNLLDFTVSNKFMCQLKTRNVDINVALYNYINIINQLQNVWTIRIRIDSETFPE